MEDDAMTTHPSLTRLARLPDVAPELHILEGDVARNLKWWIEDHFQTGFEAGGMTLVPATRIGHIDEFNDSTVRATLADLRAALTDLGVAPQQRLTIWWSTDGGMATLPYHLITAHLLDVWYGMDDVFICSPPDDWALFLYHEGQFSAGRIDPAYVERARAEDCRQPGQWPPPDDTPPATDRQQELLATLNTNRQAARPPCSGLSIQTFGELQWVMLQEVTSRPPGYTNPGAPENRRPDLRQAIMRNANLDSAFFKGAYLAEADLSGANLTDAKLQLADLRSANLTGATLYRAHCYRANLTHALLRSACLNRAYLRRADLTGADFTGTHLTATQVSESMVPQITATATDTERLWILTDPKD